MGNGYIWYQRRNEQTGLENQCWKDSWDSISYRDGRLPGFPRATCELQGYAYDAKVRGARLAREVWKDPDFADVLEKQAASLKRRFNRDFWVEDGELLRLALDTDGNQVDALASNNGHLLWSGIVDKSKAASARRSSARRRGCSPAGACARWRRARAGTTRSATTWARCGRSTTRSSPGACAGTGSRRRPRRSPPASWTPPSSSPAGCPRPSAATRVRSRSFPVQYPTACSPQAWSTGAPLLLLRTMLGLEPVGDHLIIDPSLPAGIGRLELLDIPGRWGRVDAFGRGRVEVGAGHSLRPELGEPAGQSGRRTRTRSRTRRKRA